MKQLFSFPSIETFNSCCPIFLAPPPDSGLVKRELSYPCIDVFPNGEITEGSDRCVIKHECRTDEDCGNGRKCCYSGGIQGLPFKCFTPVSCRFGK